MIRDVMESKAGTIHPDVYQAYSDNLRKAVSGVFRSDDYGDKYFDLQAQLQSNVSRFAAYKAYHLTEQLKKHYQAAEYNTATARARTAKQWTDFTSDPIANELYPNLKWLPSRSANPREEHIVFYGLVLPKTDPFWQENQPGNLWNCKCDWEETDDPAANERPATVCAKGLEGNPAETGEIFTKECTYFAQAVRNRRERDEVEEACERSNKNYVLDIASKTIVGKPGKCHIGETEVEVEFELKRLRHYADSMFGNKNFYWVKNEIIQDLPQYIESAICKGRKRSDSSHNQNRNTINLKDATDYFYYFETKLPNGETAYIHLGRWRETQKMYIYAITKNLPENIETI